MATISRTIAEFARELDAGSGGVANTEFSLLDGVTASTAELNALDVSTASGATASTFLRGDATWAAAGSTSAADLTSGTLPAARLPAGSVINSWKVIHIMTASETYTMSTTHAVVDFGSSRLMQITGITATEGNLLLITSNVGQIRTLSDGTYNTIVGPVIDGVNYNTHSTHNGQTYNQYHAVNSDVIFTVPADFTDKIISIFASKQSGSSGTHTLRSDGSASGAGKSTVFVSVLEIKQ